MPPKVAVVRRAVFSASHRLHSSKMSAEENRRVFGKCNHPNGHGHNYELEVVVEAEIDPRSGMVINLNDLKNRIESHVLERVDHRFLNLDVPEFAELNPTTENMAVVFWRWLEPHFSAGQLKEIRLRETENNLAIYRGE